MGSKALFKTSWRKKTDFLTQMCLRGPREENTISSDTRHHHRVGFPEEVPSIAPGPMTEDEMVGWHHQLDGHEFEQARELLTDKEA